MVGRAKNKPYAVSFVIDSKSKMIMEASKKNPITGKELAELKGLKRKNRRRNTFLTLMLLQAGAVVLAYYLGRSHDD